MAEELGMRIAIGQFNELTDEKLIFAQQAGVPGVQMNTPKLPGEARWEYDDLLQLRAVSRALNPRILERPDELSDNASIDQVCGHMVNGRLILLKLAVLPMSLGIGRFLPNTLRKRRSN